MTEPYKGREQSEAKHFILRRYLQKLTFKLLEGGSRELAYVDGFSGPWESRTSEYSDTSFMIAIDVLKDAHQKFRDKGVPKTIKCFFVEDNPASYKQLAAAVAKHHDPANGFQIATFQGRFEDAVSEIMKFVGRAFALVFIDPTGWTGYPYHTIAPVLRQQPSEVLINFMYDHINRFAASTDPTIVETLDPILGGPKWAERLDADLPRGLAVEKLFRSVLKTEGDFKHVLSTRIDKSTADRPHFFIAYGTRSDHGLKTFREIEYAALKGHEKRRVQAKQQKKTDRTGMEDMFSGQSMPEENTLEELVDSIRATATVWTRAHLSDVGPVKFDDLCVAMLQLFMLRVTDAKDICVAMADEGTVVNTWRADNKHKPHDHHQIGLISHAT